ncbi:MAG: flavin reductase [Dehalococcoidia bacterium]|nr:flavin reductase [Dehalococcoidia bacterium]
MPDSTPELPANAPARRFSDPIAEAMHQMPYGVYAIGSVDERETNVMVADWVMQVSFEPRLVAVVLERDSSTLGRIRAAGCFSVNLLTAEPDSLRMAMQFVQPANAAKIEGRSNAAATTHHWKLDGIEFTRTSRGLPLLDEALMWLECDLESISDVGDHVLIVGRVLDGRVVNSAEPMTTAYTGWVYSG